MIGIGIDTANVPVLENLSGNLRDRRAVALRVSHRLDAVILMDSDKANAMTGTGQEHADGGQRSAPFAVYEHGTDPRWAAHSIHVLTLEHDTIGTLTAFVPPTGPQLFHAFGLPFVLPDATRGEARSTPHNS